jgi:hypothetical protein
MSTWAITTPIGSTRDRLSVVNLTTGDSLDMTREDAALVADMLAEEFPPCEECEDRTCLVCEDCAEPGCCCACSDCPRCGSKWTAQEDADACCSHEDPKSGDPE